MIIFDVSALVSAAPRADSIPERALLRANEIDVFARSTEVEAELIEVLNRPKFARAISVERRARTMGIVRDMAVWFEPVTRVLDCRHAKDDKYLELADAAGAEIIVSGDEDLPVLHPWRGVRFPKPSEYLRASKGAA